MVLNGIAAKCMSHAGQNFAPEPEVTCVSHIFFENQKLLERSHTMRKVDIKTGTLSAAATLHAQRHRANDNVDDVPLHVCNTL